MKIIQALKGKIKVGFSSRKIVLKSIGFGLWE
jgi:hypothetical protein